MCGRERRKLDEKRDEGRRKEGRGTLKADAQLLRAGKGKGGGRCCKRKERCFPSRQAHVYARAATVSGCCHLLLPSLSHLPTYPPTPGKSSRQVRCQSPGKELDIGENHAIKSCGSESLL